MISNRMICVNVSCVATLLLRWPATMSVLSTLKHAIVIARIAAILLLTVVIDRGARWAFNHLDPVFSRISPLELLVPIVDRIHIPFLLAILTSVFFARSAVGQWFARLFGAFGATIPLICTATVWFIAIYVNHRSYAAIKPLVWITMGLGAFAIFFYSWLLPRKCPGCRARGLLTYGTSDGAVIRGKCFRCGQRFFFRTTRERSWLPGEPPSFEEPVLPPESLVFPGLMGVQLRAAKHGRPGIDPETGALQFRYGRCARYIYMTAATGVPILFLAALAIQFYRPPAPWESFLALSLLIAVCEAVFLAVLWQLHRFALIVSGDGLECRPPWKRIRFLRWEDIRDLSYSKETRAWETFFTIRARDGWKFRLSIFVPGVSEFLAQCEQHLPRESLLKARIGFLRLDRAFPEATGATVGAEIGSPP